MPISGGPHVQLATFCERVIQEKDDVVSLIRVIDRVTVTKSRDIESNTPVLFSSTLVLSLKSGSVRGTKQLKIERETPSGSVETALAPMSIHFEGEGDRGASVIGQVTAAYTEEGIYWYNVKLEDELLTRIPFRVVFAYTS